MKFLLLAILFFCSFPSFADENTERAVTSAMEKLSPQQQADLLSEATKLQQAAASPAATVTTISQYAQLGDQIGTAIASTAQKLGVVANDFIKTPAGEITLALIVWSVMGGVIVHVVCGSLFLLLGLFVNFYWYRRCFVYETTGEGKLKKKQLVASPTGDYTVAFALLVFVVIVFSTIVIFSY